MFVRESQVIILAYCHVSPTQAPHVHVDPFTGLESLHVTECGLETTAGLEGLTDLTALHLSSNHLQSLDGVRGMTRLRKLWANDNHIKTVSTAQRVDNMSWSAFMWLRDKCRVLLCKKKRDTCTPPSCSERNQRSH